MSVLNAAILGGGSIGTDHADVLTARPDTRVTALIGSEASTTALAARLASAGVRDVARYRSLAEALTDPRIELVAICTPSALHADAAIAVLGAGRHVVIEKPVDTDLRRAQRLLAADLDARDRGLFTSVISQRRFDPGARDLRAAVMAGELGRLTSATATAPWWRGQDYYDSAAWRGTWELDGGGALMNQGIHAVDLLIWLMGRPTRVTGWTATLAHDGLEVEDTAAAVIEFESGALATLHITTASFPGSPLRIQLCGDAGGGTLVGGRLVELGERPTATDDSNLPAGRVAGLVAQYDDIIGSIATGRAPTVGVADGIAALAVVAAVYLSNQSNQPVDVGDLLESASR